MKRGYFPPVITNWVTKKKDGLLYFIIYRTINLPGLI